MIMKPKLKIQCHVVGSFDFFWTKLLLSYLWRKYLWIMMTSLGKCCLQNHVAVKICDEVKWPQGRKVSLLCHHDNWYTSVREPNRLKFITRIKKLTLMIKLPHFTKYQIFLLPPFIPWTTLLPKQFHWSCGSEISILNSARQQSTLLFLCGCWYWLYLKKVMITVR